MKTLAALPGSPPHGLRPALALLLLTVTLLMGVGLSRLGFDDDYKNLYRSESQDFKTLNRFLADFPADENDLSIIFKAEDILSRASLVALMDIVDRMEALPELDTLLSIFSVPQRSASIRQTRPIFPEQPAALQDLEPVLKRAMAHPLISQHLVSTDRRVTLVIAGLSQHVNSVAEIDALLAKLEQITMEFGSTAGLRMYVTGNPAIRTALRSQAIHDQTLFNIVGGLLACLVAYLLFRSTAVTLVVSAGPFLGVIWTLGCMGFIGAKINVINQMIPPLIMVIGFTDAVHLMFSIRRQRLGGVTGLAASWNAVKELGFACGLTSVTTAIGFGALILSQAEVIQGVAVLAAIGTLLTFVCVISFVPLMASLLPDRFFVAASSNDGIAAATSRFFTTIALKTPAICVGIGMALTVIALYLAGYLTSDFRFRENLPAGHEVSVGLKTADQHLGGIQSVNIMVTWPQDSGLQDPRLYEVVKQAQRILASHSMTRNTLSMVDILSYLPGTGDDLIQRVSRLLYLPEKTLQWILNQEQRKTLIMARIPDSGARSQLPLLEVIEQQLKLLRNQYPDYDFALTGITVSAARGSLQMINDLATSLISATVIIFLLLAAVLKSLRLGAISFLPNILPLASVAALLVWLGQPLQYATIMVFSICLGIIVDDTIHFLVRYRRESHPGVTVRLAVRRTMEAVGPVLVSTTLILSAGFGALMTSATEVVVRMGMLSCLVLFVALCADLIVLPALIVLLDAKRSR